MFVDWHVVFGVRCCCLLLVVVRRVLFVGVCCVLVGVRCALFVVRSRLCVKHCDVLRRSLFVVCVVHVVVACCSLCMR